MIRAQSEKAEIRFELRSNGKSCKVTAKAKSGARSLTVTNGGDKVFDGHVRWPELQRSLARLVHLSAVRGGTPDAFPTPDRVKDQMPDVGADGRFASYWYHELADTVVDADRVVFWGGGWSPINHKKGPQVSLRAFANNPER